MSNIQTSPEATDNKMNSYDVELLIIHRENKFMVPSNFQINEAFAF